METNINISTHEKETKENHSIKKHISSQRLPLTYTWLFCVVAVISLWIIKNITKNLFSNNDITFVITPFIVLGIIGSISSYYHAFGYKMIIVMYIGVLSQILKNIVLSDTTTYSYGYTYKTPEFDNIINFIFLHRFQFFNIISMLCDILIVIYLFKIYKKFTSPNDSSSIGMELYITGVDLFPIRCYTFIVFMWVLSQFWKWKELANILNSDVFTISFVVIIYIPSFYDYFTHRKKFGILTKILNPMSNFTEIVKKEKDK